MRAGGSAKYAIVFAALALVAIGTAGMTDRLAVRVVAGWAAPGFVLMAVAYGVGAPRFLLKRADGRRSAWAWPLFGPYFALNALGLALVRLDRRQPPFAEVAPNLFLGRRLTAREARRPGAPAWCAVLDLAAEFPEAAPLRSVARYRSLPLLDATAPAPEQLAEAVEWITSRVAEGPVSVHCALGHGRSATVVVAYLLATGRAATVEEALAFVRSRRPGVRLLPTQQTAVRRYLAVRGANAGGPDAEPGIR